MSIWNYVDFETLCNFSSAVPSVGPERKGRGRPALAIDNPLDGVPVNAVFRSDGTPKQWFEDCLLGVIRIMGNQDARLKDTGRYVSFSRVLVVLRCLTGKITPNIVAETFGLSHDTGWRIVKVIQLAAPHIKRGLNGDRVTNESQLERLARYRRLLNDCNQSDNPASPSNSASNTSGLAA